MLVSENGSVREMTLDEEKELFAASSKDKIETLKQKLSDTDYKAIKYAEGWISEEDYAPIRAERQAIRDEINRLEKDSKI